MEELRSQAYRVSGPVPAREDYREAPVDHIQERRRFDDVHRAQDLTYKKGVIKQAAELSALGQVVDVSLIEVAERIMAITEQVAGDYARMEKDILDSRLAVLQSAEEVLDIAISLRRKARGLLSSGIEVRAVDPAHSGVSQLDINVDRDGNYFQDGRVSMHDHGVASLFRRT